MRQVTSAFLALLAAVALALAAACGSAAERPRADTSGAAPAARPPDPYAGEPRVADDTTLEYPGGARYVSGFRYIRYHGRLPAATKAPFVVLSGIECSACDANPSILVRSPSDGPVRPGIRFPGHFPYPGVFTQYDPDQEGRVLARWRLFIGDCLPGVRAGVAQFATEYAAGGGSSRHVRVAEVVGDSLVERELAAPLPTPDSALARVRAGVCREVPGDTLQSEP
jgi:hypothetical protein